MSPQTHSFLANIGAIGIMAGALFLLTHPQIVAFEFSPERAFTRNGLPASATSAALAPAALPASTTPPAANIASSTPAMPPASKNSDRATSTAAHPKIAPKPAPKESPAAPSAPEAVRIENPYPLPPLPAGAVNDTARAALVNVLCAQRGGSLRPISGSGVIIDPRGVILTNAHVAQYVLLASDPRVDLSCVIRNGSPARQRWTAKPLYIPRVWVNEHAVDLNAPHPLGTGEHDYALLLIDGTTDGSPLPGSFPFVAPDTREAIGFIDDMVLAASYPAEFLGGSTAQLNLYPASSFTTIKDLLTFASSTVDLVSLGGVIEAQSGSSGGAVVNGWGRLIGIISTTSEGTTTAQRDLRAITLSYIDRDIAAQTGSGLPSFLGGDVAGKAAAFKTDEAPGIIRLLTDQIKRPSY